MTATLIARQLSQDIVSKADRMEEELQELPIYQRLCAGTATREEYAAWLVQHHKYVEHTSEILQGLVSDAKGDPGAEAMLDYATHESQEEAGHDELILLDLSKLWGVSVLEALGLVNREFTCPSVAAYKASTHLIVAKYAKGVIGMACALERVAPCMSDKIRAGMLESRVEGIQHSVSFLYAHRAEVDGVHAVQAAKMVDSLSSARDRNAARFYAGMALEMYLAMAHYVNDKFSA